MHLRTQEPLVSAPRTSNRMDTKLYGVTWMLRGWHERTRSWCVCGARVRLPVLLVQRHYSRTGNAPAILAHELSCWWYDEWNRSSHIRVIPAAMPTFISSSQEISFLCCSMTSSHNRLRKSNSNYSSNDCIAEE